VCDVAQETKQIPELQVWGLPVGVTFIVTAVAMTLYVNLGQDTFLNGLIAAIALPVLSIGIVSLGTFIYSIIRRSVAEGEAERLAAASAH
jgi:hypothetical protein